MARAVAVTGLGVVSALGGNVDALAAGLVEGRCGITALKLFHHRGRANVAAEVPEDVAGFDVALDAPTTRRLSNHWITLHEVGNVAGFVPVLVIDVWEHAFILDCAPAARPKYVEAFFANIAWDVISGRLVGSTPDRSAAAR